MFRSFLLPAVAAVLMAAPPATEHRSPLRTVQAQTEAFNAHDLEAFAGTFAEGVEAFAFPSTTQGAKGREALKRTYAQRFKDHPDLHVSVKDQIVSGAYVIQRERISGRGAGKPALELVLIYQVENGLISQFWSIP